MSSVLSPEMRRRAGGRDIRIVYDEATIAARVRALGQEITAAFPDGELLVLGLLKGSFIFLSDLVRQIDRPLHLDFLVASSYGSDQVSSGNVRLVYDPETPLEGKHLLIVEDIIDSGRTMKKMLSLLADSPSGLAGRLRAARQESVAGTHSRECAGWVFPRLPRSWSVTVWITRKTIDISRSSVT